MGYIKYEYKVLRTNLMDIEVELNNESKNGWRFAQMEPIWKTDICVILENEINSGK